VILVDVEEQVSHLVQNDTGRSDVAFHSHSIGIHLRLNEFELLLAVFLDHDQATLLLLQLLDLVFRLLELGLRSLEVHCWCIRAVDVHVRLEDNLICGFYLLLKPLKFVICLFLKTLIFFFLYIDFILVTLLHLLLFYLSFQVFLLLL
jgi:hypothetical protein